jgi:hypothetical protein
MRKYVNNLCLSPCRFPRLSSPESVSTLVAALSVPLASLPASGQEVDRLLLAHMEANTAAFPSQLGHDMDEEKRMLMLLHLVGVTAVF